ncbi:MAG: phosphate/phosphite/phosphonate ABC transporter substrate-binding protein [Acidiferrobacterales bacterium]
MTKNIFAAVLILLSLAIPSTTTLAAGKTYIFSAPPRGTEANEQKVYVPIAKYLSKVLGERVEYKYPGNWLNYQNQMQQGKYDLVFDGPHFIGWRMAKIGHTPLVKLPGDLAFIVMARSDGMKLGTLAGLKVCGLAPPNLATLTLYNQFPNPLRQPQVKEVKSFAMAYRDVMNQECDAAVMRDKMFTKLTAKSETKGKVIWSSKGVSNQGFSAGPRFNAKDKQKITEALLSADAQKPLANFFDRFSKKNKKLIKATAEEYAGLGSLLKDVWGFHQ